MVFRWLAPGVQLFQCHTLQAGQHTQRPGKIVMRRKAVGRDDHRQSRRARRLQAVGRIFKRQACAGRAPGGRVFAGRPVDAASCSAQWEASSTTAKPSHQFSPSALRKRAAMLTGDVVVAMASLEPGCMCVFDQFQHARPQRHRAFLHGLFVKRRLEFVQARHGVAHPAANIDQAGLDLPPVVQDAPLPPEISSRRVYSASLQHQSRPSSAKARLKAARWADSVSANVPSTSKNQGLQHACSAYERVCAYTRLPTVVG